MRVLIVNSSDLEGGAARAAYRLHHSLLKEGVDSKLLVQSKVSDDFTVLGPISKVEKLASRIRPLLDSLSNRRYERRTKTLYSSSWLPFSNVVERINALNPDIVHLHWVASGMMRIEDVARINAPIVWSLHDMWPFTGGCHYDELCGAFKNGCGRCKVLGSSVEADLSRKVFLRKQKIFEKKKNITIVGLSRWLAREAKESQLFSGYSVVNLPNPIDTNIFAPFEKSKARELLRLPQNKKLILFGAMAATSDPRKGFRELSEALEQLEVQDVELVVFGASSPEKNTSFKQKTHYLGRLHDDVTLRVLYSAVDVMVVPSLQENLSNVIMESLACGTPVVGFNVGGNPDLVDHRVSGYLAKPYDIEDLVRGLIWVLENENTNAVSSLARQKVTREFEQSHVAMQYINLYRTILA